MRNSIPFGYDPVADKMRDSRQVHGGLACGCICPECKAPLEAVHGKKRKWHFRHAKGAAEKNSCVHPLESSIHAKSKELFSENTLLRLPKISIKPGNKVDEIVFADPADFYITGVESEYRRDGNDVIPDIVLFSGDKKMYVEILVTHATGEDKIEKLHKRGVPTLEVDLGKDMNMLETLSEAELKTLIFDNEDNKEWIYTPEIYAIKKKLSQADYLRYIYSDGAIASVSGCPMHYSEDGSSYGSEYCGFCRFCISIDPDDNDDPKHFGTIVCSARAGFSLKEDKLTEEEIKRILADERAKRKHDLETRVVIKPEPSTPSTPKPVAVPASAPPKDTPKAQIEKPVAPRKASLYKCIKCGKTGERSEFKAMRSTDSEPICDECILNGNYSRHEKSKIHYCPKCGVMLYRQGCQAKCGSFICGWTLPV